MSEACAQTVAGTVPTCGARTVLSVLAAPAPLLCGAGFFAGGSSLGAVLRRAPLPPRAMPFLRTLSCGIPIVADASKARRIAFRAKDPAAAPPSARKTTAERRPGARGPVKPRWAAGGEVWGRRGRVGESARVSGSRVCETAQCFGTG